MNFRQHVQQGFSLLEILVAFSILALSLGIILNIFSGGLRRTIISEEYQQAVIIAQAKLAASGIETELKDEITSGQLLDKYFWRVQVQPYQLNTELDEAAESDGDIPILPYQVTVTVEWFAGKSNRQIQLTTLKLAAAENE
ncbi:MAG: general secretion pathway protein I [Methyloprofundus sp.]|nr:MAG: general secretion pathway protein I [Methyloprofundus sp.]